MTKIAVVLFGLMAVASAGPLSTSEIPILSQESDVSPDGSFHNSFTAGNGISYVEDGALKQVGDEAAVVSQGVSRYTAPDGTNIELTWTADENGFQPQGAHLPVGPVGPEIPPLIARALEWAAAHPYVEPEQH